MADIFNNPFFVNALLAGVLSAVAAGIMGSAIVVKKMSAISGSIAHAAFGGLGLAYFLGFEPLLGALLFAVLSAALIAGLGGKSLSQQDALLAAVWSVGMAIGLFFIYLTPGYSGNLFSYLFGNILLVGGNELLYIFILDLIIVSAILLFYRYWLAFLFDEDFAEVSGIKVKWLRLVIFILSAAAVVVLIRSVGIILAIALLTLPAASARLLTDNFKAMIWLAVALAAFFNIAGLLISYWLNLPSGPAIVFLAALVYMAIRLFFAKRLA